MCFGNAGQGAKFVQHSVPAIIRSPPSQATRHAEKVRVIDQRHTFGLGGGDAAFGGERRGVDVIGIAGRMGDDDAPAGGGVQLEEQQYDGQEDDCAANDERGQVHRFEIHAAGGRLPPRMTGNQETGQRPGEHQ